MQQTADEVVRSVQTTDWKSELAAFTHEVEAEAQKVSHKAVEVVQHLPAQLHTRSSEVRDSHAELAARAWVWGGAHSPVGLACCTDKLAGTAKALLAGAFPEPSGTPLAFNTQQSQHTRTPSESAR